LLQEDPGVKRVTGLWRQAKCALLGIGEPPRVRSSLPMVMKRTIADLRSAEADINNRTFDEHGAEVPYAGSDRVISMRLADLLRVPHAIGVAVGASKAKGITAAARAGYINRLVTDAATAHAILDLGQ
jgi:DNA-binding transcriptional regulator LsrR (DeoR family)